MESLIVELGSFVESDLKVEFKLSHEVLSYVTLLVSYVREVLKVLRSV